MRIGATHAHVLIDHVSFSYPGSGRPVLRDVNLDVARGETLVITGATGSGKTTLLHLVPRLADVTGGRVLLGGTDVRDIPLPELRAAVGCAFEEATLFSASVRENVTFGAADATEEEIEAALTAAQARFAYELPWGLDTRIGEQGMALSGGQRQRVALARAILSRPEVLILDDPLSALDVQTEERVTTALHEILAGVTALVVAHRPSTVALADRVALLDDGVIAAVGGHRELMATRAGLREPDVDGGGDPVTADTGTAPAGHGRHAAGTAPGPGRARGAAAGRDGGSRAGGTAGTRDPRSWRGIAAETADEHVRAARGAAAKAEPPAARRPAAAAPQGRHADRRRDHRLLARLAGRAVADRHRDRQRHPAAGEAGTRGRCCGSPPSSP